MGRLDSFCNHLPVWGQHAAVSAYGLYWQWTRFGPGIAGMQLSIVSVKGTFPRQNGTSSNRITGYAVSYYLLAQFVLEQCLKPPPLRAVITTSEKMIPHMKQVME